MSVVGAPKSFKTASEYRRAKPTTVSELIPPSKSSTELVVLSPGGKSEENAACILETDASGRILCVQFETGDITYFKYNNVGALCGFNFAGLDWLLSDQLFWQARDRQTDYRIEALISVLSDGSLEIRKDDLIRTIRLSGLRIDEHKSGCRTESRKVNKTNSPYDLLARARPITSVWLNSSMTEKQPSASQAIGTLRLVEEQSSDISTLIPLSPLKDADSNEVELPATKLRRLEKAIAAHKEPESFTKKIRDACFHYGLTTAIQVVEMWKGKDSPRHLLPYLDQLSAFYSDKQLNDLAEINYARALRIREAYYGRKQPELAISIAGLACIHHRRGNYRQAEKHYKEAADLYHKGLRKTAFMYSRGTASANKFTKEMEALFSCLSNLTRLYADSGKMTRSLEQYEKALMLWTDLLEQDLRLESVILQTIDSYITAMRAVVQRLRSRTDSGIIGRV